MIKVFRKSSKLIIIFILTVIVSGGILAYLSITHISNYRELLEKKISEEEREVSNRFSSDFQSSIDAISSKFTSFLEQSELNIERLKNVDAIDVNPFIAMDRSGSFLIPNFLNNEDQVTDSKPSKTYLERLREAENKEFNVSDFNSAKSYYSSALQVAVSKLDSAHIYNSLGRLYVKMDLPEEAFDTYQTILTKFQSITTSSGFPYAYFSIIKLLNNDNLYNVEQLKTLVLTFLEELEDGTIPLNDSTTEILDLIETWQEDHSNELDNTIFKRRIDSNNNSLHLIDNYKTELEITLEGKKDSKSDNGAIEYVIIKPASGSTNELMLFYNVEPIATGIVIVRSYIFTGVMENIQRDDLQFEYQLDLIEKTNTNNIINTNVITTTEFSSLFENSLLQVSLKNENVIDERVQKKQITYGIGLVIFLGIMVMGLYVLIQDVNRERRMNKLRADFVSNVTHELKTPLTSIHMFAESILLGRVKSDTDLNKYANIIVRESENLKRMINNILEFSRKENNKLVYQIKEINLSDLVNTTMEEMNYWLEINGFKVAVEIEENVFAKVEQEGLKQALSNLISNAIKYSLSHKELIVRLFKKEKKAHIEIEDFGIGIPKDRLDLIFEKFYRVNSAESESVSGTGLGLTVTRDIIEAQKGELLVESTLGKGSKFTIMFNV
ncbi:HAMP domain-containing histidine kinase [Flavobacteriaceae bacterium S0862]|nr:HAMP domain-containing histidine kinase [Flavobacteriaceae bacterium S0862]